MQDEVKTAQQRARLYWYRDGISEIAFGVICLFLGLYFLILAVLPPGSLLASMLSIGMVFYILASGYITTKAVNAAKARLVYPRSGYVQLRPPPTRRRYLVALLAMLISGSVIALLSFTSAPISWIPAISGFIFAVVLAFLGYQNNLPRFYGLSVLALVIGIAVAISNLEQNLDLALFYTGIGVAIILSGLLVLRNYLKSTPLSGEELS